jgi:hypothetical protein
MLRMNNFCQESCPRRKNKTKKLPEMAAFNIILQMEIYTVT